jgi:hypothetical protein
MSKNSNTRSRNWSLATMACTSEISRMSGMRSRLEPWRTPAPRFGRSFMFVRKGYISRGAVKPGRNFPSLRIIGVPVLVVKDCENILLGPAVIAP